MKACRNTRKAIVQLVAGELEPREAERLHAHSKICPACAHYLQEMTAVSESLLAGANQPDVEASASFHSAVVRRLRSREPAAGWHWFEQLTSIEKWGLAAAALAVGLIVLSAIFVRLSHGPPSDMIKNNVPSRPEPELAPTLSNYQIVANRSLEEFDGLLTRQANRALPRAPLYTPSSVGNGWD